MAEELPVPVEKIKKEKLTPPSSPVRSAVDSKFEEIAKIFRTKKEAELVANGDTSDTVDVKKETGPVKTSDEILLELFQVFNAAPPEDKSIRKKHKKHKKKSKKKKRDSKNDDLSDISAISDVDNGRGKHKEKSPKDRSTERNSKRSRDSENDRKAVKVKREKRSRSRERPSVSHRIVIKDLKNSQVLAEAETASRRKRRASSSLSLSDEETYERERRSRTTRTRRPSAEREKRNSFRSSYRELTRSSRPAEDMRERIDQKKLLEIARKNAMQMMKDGQLPGSALRELEKARYGGKSIGELTDFCKKLSNGDELNDLSSLSGDSDHDGEGNSKAFNHPFVLKDRGPIVMNIRNSVPLPTRTVDQTNAILQAFPVSSGQQHRISEMEWVAVEPTKTNPVETPPAKPVKKPETVTTVAVLQPSSSVAQHSLPPQMNHPPAFVTYPPLKKFPNAGPVEPLQPPPQPPPAMLCDNVFPAAAAPVASVDVSAIISQRLNAMRKLQENPNDNSAMALMENTQKDMTNWAASKFTPGKFLGSTGANILSVKQLQSGGSQAWARKDAFTSSAPLSGGKGMHLLQKMGWKPGEALGKEKTGSLEPLLLEVKLDRKGLIADEEGPRKKRPTGGGGGSRNMQMTQQALESKHPVSLLGELASKRKWGAPMYELVHESGPHHHKSFVYQVIMNSMSYTPAVPCTTKKEAKKLAAQVCLEQMGVLPTLPNPS